MRFELSAQILGFDANDGDGLALDFGGEHSMSVRLWVSGYQDSAILTCAASGDWKFTTDLTSLFVTASVPQLSIFPNSRVLPPTAIAPKSTFQNPCWRALKQMRAQPRVRNA
jgi:hypothetical protein